MLTASAVPAAKTYELFTPAELYALGDTAMIYDVESYPNYFLVSFKDYVSGKIVYFEIDDAGCFFINGFQVDYKSFADILGYVLHRFLLIGFNSKAYDLHMCGYALDGVNAEKLKEISNQIIREDNAPYQLRLAKVNHIDLIEVAPLQASLKMYGGRLHCQRMQDLPIDDSAILTPDQKAIVRDYNINDLDVTLMLYEHLKPHIELREFLSAEYNIDLRSKSDAQVGEAVILGELARDGIRPPKPTDAAGQTFRYQVPPGLAFSTPALQRVLETVASVTFEVGINGHVGTPAEISAIKLHIGKCDYRLGNGGLHTCEKSISHYSTNAYMLIDKDVASYYPRIIINQRLFPESIGPAFIDKYIRLVERRLLAKAEGRKLESEGLKISINGIFGKLNEIFSRLYSHTMVTQITLSGQLFLLMFIEAIENAGIEVVSANTDGVVINCHAEQYELLQQIVGWWEAATGFTTEETRYKSLHCRDVNNYIAVKDDGKCKLKGVYAEVGSALNSPLSKNPESLVISDAIQAFVTRGIGVEETVRQCDDIRRFVNVRNVRGGAFKNGQYLGKAVRWYYAVGERGAINSVLHGSIVPKTEGARPLMELPNGLPDDLDYAYYMEQANEALFDLGIKQRPTVGMLL